MWMPCTSIRRSTCTRRKASLRLKAGKHVACTVPAATSVEDCRAIVNAANAAGKNYMMMETAIYTREFLYVRELRDTGKLGRIQFMRGAHQQEMAGWPGYWEGLPPMHYATHAVSPCLALVRGEAEYVSCFGSGRIADRPDRQIRIALCGRERAVQGARPAAGVRSDSLAVRDCAAVRREFRRLRRQGRVRMDADRKRSSR